MRGRGSIQGAAVLPQVDSIEIISFSSKELAHLNLNAKGDGKDEKMEKGKSEEGRLIRRRRGGSHRTFQK